MNLPLIEAACAVILIFHVGLGLKLTRNRRAFVRRFFILAGASLIAEDTCIRIYQFYSYNPDWSIFIDKMPLMIALIWPSVILSAREVAERLLSSDSQRWLPLATGALVFADAWLIEPIAVQAGLWEWYEPGLFGVPVIGVLGWSIFTTLAVAILRFVETRDLPPAAETSIIVLVPLGTHALLLAFWWGFFRWVNVPIPPWPAVAVAWAISLWLAWTALRTRASAQMPVGGIYSRIPPALFFFVLLGLYGHSELALVAWAVAFAPPWVALTPWSVLRGSAGSPTRASRN